MKKMKIVDWDVDCGYIVELNGNRIPFSSTSMNHRGEILPNDSGPLKPKGGAGPHLFYKKEGVRVKVGI